MNPQFMQLCIELALEGIEKKGHGPFGAVVVKDNNVVGVGTNKVTSSCDPTAHAEICAIRDASFRLSNFSLKGCHIYTSCEPCPMCLGAIFWSRMDKIFYGATRIDAAHAQFDDHHFYEEVTKAPEERAIPMVQLMRSDCLNLFEAWKDKSQKMLY